MVLLQAEGMSAHRAWHCAHPIDEVLLAWEGEQHAVFFNPVTGDTHLIGAMALLLLDMIGRVGQSREQLQALLHNEFEAEQVALPPDLLNSHLQRLSDIGLLSEIAV